MRLSRKKYVSLSYNINVEFEAARKCFNDKTFTLLGAAGYSDKPWTYWFKRTLPIA